MAGKGGDDQGREGREEKGSANWRNDGGTDDAVGGRYKGRERSRTGKKGLLMLRGPAD